MKKKIAYISGTRADFGLMTPVLHSIEKSEKLQLLTFATGVHLMPDFGNTINHVTREFPNTKIIPATFTSDDRTGMANFMGEYLQQLVKTLTLEKPDFVLILGDRVEMLCTALACVYLGIPTGHLHGGEKTSTVDEVSRHAITKLASVHFAATKESAKRIKKMGEEDWRIHVVGAPALDIILNEELPKREELFQKLGLNPKDKIILVVQHPVTEQIDEAGKQMEETISAVKPFNLPVVLTFPHPDPGGREIIKVIEKERNNPLFHIFPSLEYKDFLALEREALVMVGNSSAGMIESSSFKIPVVNIGDRQKGRQHGGNVTHVGYNKEKIRKAIEKSLYDPNYLKSLKGIVNPYGDGKAGQKVTEILENLEFGSKLLNKRITY